MVLDAELGVEQVDLLRAVDEVVDAPFDLLGSDGGLLGRAEEGELGPVVVEEARLREGREVVVADRRCCCSLFVLLVW